MNNICKSFVEVPVLFITFARNDYARQTFDAIKLARPARLYFYSNKARSDRPEEIERNNQIREFIKEINWECELFTFFRDAYVDICTSLWSAIDWIFDNEEQGIILEEDCVPSLAFFDFCAQLLPKYKEDQRIWVISGNNFIEGFNPNGYDYFFSPFAYQYGWASWRDRWKNLNKNGFSVTNIIQYDLYRQLYGTRKGANQSYKWLKKVQNEIGGIYKPKEWDYTFQMTMRCNGGFGVVPKKNLVSNIGVFGVHNSSFNKDIHNKPLQNTEKYPIDKHPPFVVSDFKFTNKFFNKITNKKMPFYKRAINYLKKLYGNSKKQDR